MRAGRLRWRVTFQRKKADVDKFGTTDQVEYDDLCTVWAGIERLTGREVIAGLRTDAEVTARIVCRRSSETLAVTANDRATCDGRIYDIAAQLPTTRLNELTFLCTDHKG